MAITYDVLEFQDHHWNFLVLHMSLIQTRSMVCGHSTVERGLSLEILGTVSTSEPDWVRAALIGVQWPSMRVGPLRELVSTSRAVWKDRHAAMAMFPSTRATAPKLRS